VGAVLADVPAELALDFVRGAIVAGRARSPKLESGALTFAVERATGLTDYFTLFITPDEVTLKPSAAPYTWAGPLVTVFLREDALSSLLHGGGLEGADVMGDTQLLGNVALALSGGYDPLTIRLPKR